MSRNRLLSFLSLVIIATMLVTSCQTPTPAPTAPPPTAAVSPTQAAGPTAQPAAVTLPAFDSACTPADEGTVKAVDKQPAKPLKIAVLGLENNPFWIPVKQGAQKAAEELKAYNVTVDWIVPGEQHTGDVFGPGIEAAIAQKYDAIATIAGEAGVAPFIDKAVAAGIPVATFNSETATKNGRAFFVGADLYKQGEAAGTAMAKAIGGKGKVAIITGFLAVEAHELRRKGFVDYLAKNNPDVTIVGTSENQDKGDVAFTQANDFMTANPDLAGIYVTAGGPFGAAEAVDKAGKTGKVQVVSFDFVDETMAYVQKGVIYGTIGQDPFAQGHDPAIRLFNMLVGGVSPECGRMVTKSDVVTKDNISQFWTGPATSTAQPAAVTLPAFDSACTPADEGTVKAVDKQPAKPLKIAVLGLENNPFWIPVKQGAQKAAEELKAYNVTVDWIVPGEQHTGDVFGPGIEAAIAQKYDAIATIAGEAGVAPFIDKAVAAGIPVATFNSETATKNGRAFFVGADLYKQGEAAGTAMAKAIGGKGKVAIITGFLAVEAHELRRKGFVDYLAKNNPDVTIVGTSENQDKGDVAFTQANDFMTANPDLAGIYVTAGGPFGAAEAVDKAGKTGKVQVVSFDFVDETMAYVQKGVIYGTIGQDPFAQGHDPAIRLFNMLVGGVSPECGRMVTKSDVVTKDNISQFWTAPGSAPAVKLPAFDSACTPADEGTVKAVDKQPAKPLKIAVLGLENNPFWIPVKQGAQKAAEELKAYNVTVDWIVPGEQHTGDVFGPGIEAAIAQKYDAIATIAGEAGVAPFIDKAVAAGIPVATFNSETATKNGRAFFVGADLYKQGEAAGTAMAKAIGGKGKVAIITGFLAVEAHELRRKGFVDYLAKNNPDVTIVGTSENQDKGDVAFTQANDFMTANPDLAGIYVTAGGPFGAAEAVDKAGKTGKVQVVSFDFVDETMAYVQKGVIYGTIGQDPFAQGHDPAIRLFNMLVGGVSPECGRMVTKSDVVTKDNISQFWTAPK